MSLRQLKGSTRSVCRMFHTINCSPFHMYSQHFLVLIKPDKHRALFNKDNRTNKLAHLLRLTHCIVRTYITSPPNTNNDSVDTAILIMTDVLGMDFPNIQLLADQFAQNGYLTLIPDVFNGAEVPFPIPDSFNLQTYI